MAWPCAHPSPGGLRHHGAHRHGALPPLRRRQPDGHQLPQGERSAAWGETEPGGVDSYMSKRSKTFNLFWTTSLI